MADEQAPRYVIGGRVNSWYPASVIDTQHERGKSPTRKTIPRASLAVAHEVATELNAGTVSINQ
jgi:hypothetical protein